MNHVKVAAALWLLLSGCVGVQQAHQDTALFKLRSRAGYDFACPPNQLLLTPLEQRANGWSFLYGVEGCGRRASYILVPQHYERGQWLQNSDSSAIQAATAAEEERRRRMPPPPPPSFH